MIKHLTVLSFLFLFSLSGMGKLYAQISKGSIEMGTLGYYHSGEYVISQGAAAIDGTNSEWSINGEIGYLFTDYLSAGIRFSQQGRNFTVNDQLFNRQTRQYEALEVNDFRSIFGLYGRYYLGLSDYAKAYGKVGLGFGSSEYSYNEEDSASGTKLISQNRNVNDGFLGVGLVLLPAEYMALDLSIGQYFREETYEFNNNSRAENINSLQFEIGVRIFISPRTAFRRDVSPPKKEFPFR